MVPVVDVELAVTTTEDYTPSPTSVPVSGSISMALISLELPTKGLKVQNASIPLLNVL